MPEGKSILRLESARLLCLHDSDRRTSAADASHVAKGGVDDEVSDDIAVEMEVMDNSWIECLRVNGPVGGQRQGHRHQ
jgi:hypothetical protein